jgi:hypothetical protein
MRRIRRGILALSVATVLAGACGKPVLDPADLERSIAKLRDSVEMSRRVHFDEAIALVREASTGTVAGTKPFSLAGMTAGAVIAEAERIEIRRERALESVSIADYREVLDAETQLDKLRVLQFIAFQVDPTHIAANVTIRNRLSFPVDTAWLRVEVGIPGGASTAGDEFLAFQPSLKPDEAREVRIMVAGSEARSLPVEPPAEARYQFQLIERGGKVVLQMPTPEMRRKAEAGLADVQRRVADLDARLAAVKTID